MEEFSHRDVAKQSSTGGRDAPQYEKPLQDVVQECCICPKKMESVMKKLRETELELSVIDKIIKVLRHQECDDAFSHKDDAISCCRGHCKFAEDEKLWRLIQEYWEKDRNSTTTKLGRRSGSSKEAFSHQDDANSCSGRKPCSPLQEYAANELQKESDSSIKASRDQEYDKALSQNDDANSCHRGHWTVAEDEKLLILVQEYGPRNWNSIASKLGGRSGTTVTV